MPPSINSKAIGLRRAISLSALIGFSVSGIDTVRHANEFDESVASMLAENRSRFKGLDGDSRRAGLYFEFGVPHEEVGRVLRERGEITHLLHKGVSMPVADILGDIEDVPMGYSPSTAGGLNLAIAEYAQMLDLDELTVLLPESKMGKVTEILYTMARKRPELLEGLGVKLEFIEGEDDRVVYHRFASEVISLLNSLDLEDLVINFKQPGRGALSDYLKVALPDGARNMAIIMLFLLISSIRISHREP